MREIEALKRAQGNLARENRTLKAENKRLREALEAIRDTGKGPGGSRVVTDVMLRKIAAQALADAVTGGEQ